MTAAGLPSLKLRVAPAVSTGGALVAVKLKLKLAAMVSGGSIASVSVTWLPITVTAQLPSGRLALGSSVAWLVPVPLTVKVCALPQLIVKLPRPKFTFSLKFTTMLPAALALPPLGGLVVVTVGAGSVVVKFTT